MATFIFNNHQNNTNYSNYITSPKINNSALASIFNNNQIKNIIVNSGNIINYNNEEIKKLNSPLEHFGASKSGIIYRIMSNNCIFPIKQSVNSRCALVSLNRKKYEVKRLVASAWIPNPDNLPVVINIDRNPANNNISNLIWTHQRDAVLVCDKKKSSFHSKFKGVSFLYNKNKPWICQHHHNGKVFHSSFHKTELEAAKTYNDVVLSLNPKICVLNNINNN
jgi:hypothetical protein